MENLKQIKVSPPEGPEGVNAESKYFFTPSFKVDSDQMPEIKSWENGGKYKMIIEVEQMEKNDHEDGNDATFDIVAYQVIPTKGIDDMTDEEFGEYQGKSLDKGELA